MKILFIGLGVMGAPMAGHLAKAGHDVCVYNRSGDKAEQWLSKYDGKRLASLNSDLTDFDAVLTCLGNDQSLESVYLDPKLGILNKLKANTLVIDHTTASAKVTKRIYDTAQKLSLKFVDAPVSGGQAGAENGQLSIMMGGDDLAIQAAITLIQPYTKIAKHIGPSGSGQLCKMVNQICIGGLIQGLSEAMNFAEMAGLDLNKVMPTISQGAAGSWQMTNRWQTMMNNEYDHGFAVDWMVKDLDICMDQAKSFGAPLPITEAVFDFYKELQANGHNRSDTSSLFARIKSL